MYSWRLNILIDNIPGNYNIHIHYYYNLQYVPTKYIIKIYISNKNIYNTKKIINHILSKLNWLL